MSEKIFLQVEVVRDPAITTLINYHGKEESVVMFVGKITAPANEASEKNIVFFYTKAMHFTIEEYHSVTPIFSAIATSKAGDSVLLKSAISKDCIRGRYITGMIHDDSFYNKMTSLGEELLLSVDM